MSLKLQKLQDKQGYIIVANQFEYPPGHVFNNVRAFERVYDFKLVVVGAASMDEWKGQCLEVHGYFDENGLDRFFHKVRAE